MQSSKAKVKIPLNQKSRSTCTCAMYIRQKDILTQDEVILGQLSITDLLVEKTA